MSDNWIRLIPTSSIWQPDAGSAAAATKLVSRLFAVADASAQRVECRFYERVALIDSGVNTAAVTCRVCRSITSVEWVFEAFTARSDDLDELTNSMPCCGSVTDLDQLDYDWPMGFTRFEIAVLNASRAQYDLRSREIDRVSAVLGHRIRQVLAHY